MRENAYKHSVARDGLVRARPMRSSHNKKLFSL